MQNGTLESCYGWYLFDHSAGRNANSLVYWAGETGWPVLWAGGVAWTAN